MITGVLVAGSDKPLSRPSMDGNCGSSEFAIPVTDDVELCGTGDMCSDEGVIMRSKDCA